MHAMKPIVQRIKSTVQTANSIVQSNEPNVLLDVAERHAKSTRSILAVMALAASCSNSAAPAGSVDVSILAAGRPTTSYRLVNRRPVPVAVQRCKGEPGAYASAAVRTGKLTIIIRYCDAGDTVAVAPGASLDGVVKIDSAGTYTVRVPLTDSSTAASREFIVP